MGLIEKTGKGLARKESSDKVGYTLSSHSSSMERLHSSMGATKVTARVNMRHMNSQMSVLELLATEKLKRTHAAEEAQAAAALPAAEMRVVALLALHAEVCLHDHE